MGFFIEIVWRLYDFSPGMDDVLWTRDGRGGQGFSEFPESFESTLTAYVGS